MFIISYKTPQGVTQYIPFAFIGDWTNPALARKFSSVEEAQAQLDSWSVSVYGINIANYTIEPISNP